MNGRKNLFTKKDIPPIFNNLTYDKPITLTSADPIYFAVRSLNDKRAIPIAGTPYVEPFNPLVDDEYALIPKEQYDNDTDIRDEINFLKTVSLVVEREEGSYISPLAFLLYDPTNGLFIKNDKKTYGDFIQLVLTYILPGRYWTAFQARQWLPNTIRYTHALHVQMQEIEQEWNQFNANL